jgi:DNA-binding XRE family transcriptional regulator
LLNFYFFFAGLLQAPRQDSQFRILQGFKDRPIDFLAFLPWIAIAELTYTIYYLDKAWLARKTVLLLTIVCRTKVIIYLYCKQNFMKKEILVKFGNKVRQERERLGLSQEKLAARAGVHRTYIGMIERAEKNITLENVEKIAKALGIKISDFF